MSQLYPSLLSAELPPCLRELSDAPERLYYRGNPQLLGREPKIAVIGTRQPSDYGKEISAQVGRELAQAGVRVVSGLARGIDGLTQEAVVNAGGETIAVLGTAIDDIAPSSNRPLGKKIEQHGLIISEYPPGTEYRSWNFPQRNRLISGLTRAVVIIEAAEQSGTLITAQYALEQGREVFAFPGRIDSELSAGTHALLREGARLVRSTRDILTDLGLAGTQELPFEKGSLSPYNDKEIDDPVLACLGSDPVHMDQILEKTGFKVTQLSQNLLELELAGKVRQLPGQRYVRNR